MPPQQKALSVSGNAAQCDRLFVLSSGLAGQALFALPLTISLAQWRRTEPQSVFDLPSADVPARGSLLNISS